MQAKAVVQSKCGAAIAVEGTPEGVGKASGTLPLNGPVTNHARVEV